MVAAKVKMNANGAHTFLEIVKARFGTGAHLLFAFYAFVCVMLVCGSLLRTSYSGLHLYDFNSWHRER